MMSNISNWNGNENVGAVMVISQRNKILPILYIAFTIYCQYYILPAFVIYCQYYILPILYTFIIYCHYYILPLLYIAIINEQ